jgi:hypothetical protein
MNLKKLFFWETEKNKLDDEVNRNEIGEIASGSDDVISNVIRLPNTSPVTDPVGLKNYQEDGAPKPLQKQLGLMDELEIKKFFGQNHFGLGRHNGSVYKTQAALDLGKQSIISEFQNVLEELYERKNAKQQKLQLMALQTNGYCEVTSSMLEYAKSNVQRDMNILQDQISDAEQGKGWVLQALNTYQIGFGKGVGEAVDFELNGQ